MDPASLIHPTAWAAKSRLELNDIAESEGSVLVVPVGSLEQHGAHLPTATDTLLANAVARRGAEGVAGSVPVAVTPPVWSGYSPMHLRSFGATVSLPFGALRATIEGVAGSALETGFDGLALVNGHGGNGPAVGAATSTVGVEHPDVEVVGLTYYHLADSFVEEIRDSDPGGMSHGGEFETSLMLHLRPDLVDEDAGEWANRDPHYTHADDDITEVPTLSTYRSSAEYSGSGAEGNPTLATAAKGEELFERVSAELVVVLEELHEAATG